MRFVKIKSQEWMDKNSFEDSAGDLWESNDRYKDWRADNRCFSSGLKSIHIEKCNIGKFMDIDIWKNLNNDTEVFQIGWAIEKDCPIEKNPELYI